MAQGVESWIDHHNDVGPPGQHPRHHGASTHQAGADEHHFHVGVVTFQRYRHLVGVGANGELHL